MVGLLLFPSLWPQGSKVSEQVLVPIEVPFVLHPSKVAFFISANCHKRIENLGLFSFDKGILATGIVNVFKGCIVSKFNQVYVQIRIATIELVKSSGMIRPFQNEAQHRNQKDGGPGPQGKSRFIVKYLNNDGAASQQIHDSGNVCQSLKVCGAPAAVSLRAPNIESQVPLKVRNYFLLLVGLLGLRGFCVGLALIARCLPKPSLRRNPVDAVRVPKTSARIQPSAPNS